MQSLKANMTRRDMRLVREEQREALEKRRSGMPGAIRQGNTWTRQRHDLLDATVARVKSPSLG